MSGYIIFTPDGKVTETRQISDLKLRVEGTYAYGKTGPRWFLRSNKLNWESIDPKEVPAQHRAMVLLIT